jgi:hypothetical protein
MDELTPVQTVEPANAALQEQINALRQLITTILILLIVGSGTFTIFMYRQHHYSRIDAMAVRQIVDEYNNTHKPVLEDMRIRLQEYARTHPDFTPLANKYGLVQSTAANPAVMPSTSSPAKKK